MSKSTVEISTDELLNLELLAEEKGYLKALNLVHKTAWKIYLNPEHYPGGDKGLNKLRYWLVEEIKKHTPPDTQTSGT